jgi:hypothetical protein
MFYVSRQKKYQSFITGLIQIFAGLVTVLTLGWIGCGLSLVWSEACRYKKLYGRWPIYDPSASMLRQIRHVLRSHIIYPISIAMVCTLWLVNFFLFLGVKNVSNLVLG